MKKAITLLSAGLLLSAAVHANPLLPATSLVNPDLLSANPEFSVGLPANYANYVLVDTLVSAYVGAFTGAVTTNVWRDPASAGGDDTLTFVYHFTNTSSLPVKDIVRATIGDPSQPWLGYVISAGADESGTSSDGGGGGINWSDGDPNFILRDPTVSGEGLTIQWRSISDGTVLRNPTDESALVWFDTNAIDYQLTNVGILDSGLTANAQGFAPLAIIPEPTSLALFGLLGLGLIRRRC